MMIVLFSLCLPAMINAYFCSAFCSPNQCSGVTSSTCLACDAPFYVNGSQCSFDTDMYELIEETDMNISIQKTDTCKHYSYYGKYDSSETPIVQTNNAVTTPHFGFRFIMWLFFEDYWISGDYVRIYQNQLGLYKYYYAHNKDTEENLTCGYTFYTEKFSKVDEYYSHSASEVLQFSLWTNHFYDYGVKEFMVLLYKCHAYCSACTIYSNEHCSSCASGYKLSGSVCEADCLDGYGEDGTSVCIVCISSCLECSMVANNCTECYHNGSNEGYLFSNNNSCLTSCPSGYAAI